MQRAPNAWDRHYHRHEAPWRGERPVADLLPWLGPGPVLELGCGNGKLLRPLARAGVDVVGLDVSWNALRGLRRGSASASTPPAAGVPRVPLLLADAALLPFADGAFSAVLDVHCTGHLLAPGRAAAALEKHRVLRAGGHLVVERLAPDDLRASQGTQAEQGTRRVADGRTTHFSDAPDILAEHPGFVQVDRRSEVRSTRYGTAAVTRSSVRLVLQKA